MKTLLDAIAIKRKSFNGKLILYLDSRFPYGRYKNKLVRDIRKIDVRYLQWFISTFDGYVADEVALDC
jgi:uncharacterized protein (DUF3820 family)